MAAETVFSIIEIRDLILAFTSFSTLTVCARVNSRWHRESIALLWRGHERASSGHYNEDADDRSTPDVGHLARMAARDPARLRDHLSHTCYLDLHSREERCNLSSLSHLFVPEVWSRFRARYVEVDITSEFMPEAHMALLVQPNLRVLALYGGYYSDSFFRVLAVNAPHLQSLLLDNRSPGDMSSHGLCALLDAVPSLNQLELLQGWDNALDNDSLLKILSRVNLRHLSVAYQDKPGSVVTRDLAEQLAGTQYSGALQQLVKLDISAMELGSVPSVLRRARYLRSASLTSHSLENADSAGVSSASALFDALSTIPTLEDVFIDLEYTRDTSVMIQGLTAISKGCPQMRSFELHAETTRFVAHHAPPTQLTPHNQNSLDTDTLKDVTKRWPLLRSLTLAVPFALILSTTFWSIATHCPHLSILELSAQVDLFSAPVSPPEARFLALVSLDVHVAAPISAIHRDGEPAQPDDTVAALEDDLLEMFVWRMPALLYRGLASNRVLWTILEQMRGRVFGHLTEEQRDRLREQRFIDVPPWVSPQATLIREGLQY